MHQLPNVWTTFDRGYGGSEDWMLDWEWMVIGWCSGCERTISQESMWAVMDVCVLMFSGYGTVGKDDGGVIYDLTMCWKRFHPQGYAKRMTVGWQVYSFGWEMILSWRVYHLWVLSWVFETRMIKHDLRVLTLESNHHPCLRNKPDHERNYVGRFWWTLLLIRRQGDIEKRAWILREQYVKCLCSPTQRRCDSRRVLAGNLHFVSVCSRAWLVLEEAHQWISSTQTVQLSDAYLCSLQSTQS